jgi:hypothetical protein
LFVDETFGQYGTMVSLASDVDQLPANTSSVVPQSGVAVVRQMSSRSRRSINEIRTPAAGREFIEAGRTKAPKVQAVAVVRK